MIEKLWLLGTNTLRETVRQRLFLNILVFGVLLIGLAQVVGNLTFGRADRVVRAIGLSGMSLSLDLLVILVGVALIYREVERRTALVVLTHPVGRGELVVGRYFGLGLATVFAGLGFAVIFAFTLASVRGSISVPDMLAMGGAVLEALVVGSFAVLVSCLTTPTLGAGVAVGFLIAAASIDDVVRLTESEGGFAHVVAQGLSYVLPNLNRVNFREAAVYQEIVAPLTVLQAGAYSLAFIVVFLGLATLALRNRELL